MQSALQAQSKLFSSNGRRLSLSFAERDLSGKPGLAHHIPAIGKQLGENIKSNDVSVCSYRFKQEQGLKPDPTARIQPAASPGELQGLDDGTKQWLAQRVRLQ